MGLIDFGITGQEAIDLLTLGQDLQDIIMLGLILGAILFALSVSGRKKRPGAAGAFFALLGGYLMFLALLGAGLGGASIIQYGFPGAIFFAFGIVLMRSKDYWEGATEAL